MICAGIDAGSRTLKVLFIDASRTGPGRGRRCQPGGGAGCVGGATTRSAADRKQFGPRDVGTVVATGYGRKLIHAADTTITEITCQARGVHHCTPAARTIIDIGGQDSKLLRLDGSGAVADFVMNDRCAAGTGRFLEVLATRLGVRLASLGELAHRSERPAIISSMCVVFAETEIIGLLASGTPPADIVAGVQASIATRVAAMSGRNVATPVIFTGGVAMVPGMNIALENALRTSLLVPPDPQFTCALGAAFLAADRLRS